MTRLVAASAVAVVVVVDMRRVYNSLILFSTEHSLQ